MTPADGGTIGPHAVHLEAFAYPPDVLAVLDAHLDLTDLSALPGGSPQLAAALRAADPEVLIVRLGLRVDAALLDACPRLRLVVTPTTGLDHLDLDELAARGIEVLSLRSVPGLVTGVHATAEHTWALLLACVRRIPTGQARVAAGVWDRHPLLGTELAGRTLGIIGHGRLGRQVGRYGAAFGMRVLVHDTDPAALTDLPAGVAAATADEVLVGADVLSLHLPLDATTRGWLSAARIARLPRGAIVVNTARGDLVDEHALAAALHDGHLGGVATDVLADDGNWHGRTGASPLLELLERHDGLVVTPHVGGWARDAVATTRRRLVETLVARLGAEAR